MPLNARSCLPGFPRGQALPCQIGGHDGECFGFPQTIFMRQRILDECVHRGTCPLNRTEFDEAFAGADLTIQIRTANDFAQQHGLAFARSTGDQHFLFSRLPKLEEGRNHNFNSNQNQNGRQRAQAGKNRRRGKRNGQPQRQKARKVTQRPFGRSF